MGNKGGTKHLKRLPSPAHLPISRKSFQWIVRSSSGPHALDKAIPIAVLLRESMRLAKTRQEATKVVSEGNIRVDGRTCPRDDYPLGIMDVLEIEKLGKAYRILLNRSGKLFPLPIGDDEKSFKLCRITGKTTQRGGVTQLNLSGGRNVILDGSSASNYEVSDVVKLRIPESEILDHIRFKEGTIALVTGGKGAARWGKITKIEGRKGRFPDIVTLEDDGGLSFITTKDYAFPLGEGTSTVSLTEAG